MLTNLLPSPVASAIPLVAVSSTHQLPPLGYELTALEPALDARTMALHHGKHHASYVDKLNLALQNYPVLQERSATWLLLNPLKIPREIRTVVRQNAGGHVNHSLFWRAMSPQGGGAPTGLLADAITRDFGSFELFKTGFEEMAGGLFGSGWAWLVRSSSQDGPLQLLGTAGHDNPMPQGHYPILLNDVWEHAYYLRHENRRTEYLKAWWSVVDWQEADRRFTQSGHLKSGNGNAESPAGAAWYA